MTATEVSSILVNKKPKRLNQLGESEMYQAVEITGCFLRAVFVLAPNPTRNWTQSSKIQPHFKHCCDFFFRVLR